MLSRIRLFVCNVEKHVFSAIFGRPPGSFALALDHGTDSKYPSKATQSSLQSLLNDCILWAVPKSRRTKEKRLNRKFGWPEYHWKPLVPKTNIISCTTCGHDQEAGHLCPNCYSRVRTETEQMQKAIEAELKLNPIDKEVVILYDGESKVVPQEYWEGKRIIEMKKERPSWFSKNLLQRSTDEKNASTPAQENVKPKDLG